MYTLSFSFGLAESEDIVRLMNKVDPEGAHRIESNVNEARHLISSERPDVVWLAANEENFALAQELRKASRRTNFIFVAQNSGMAFEAMKVRASGYVLEPVDEESVRTELAELRYPVVEDKTLLNVQCFGNFEVFCDGRIVRFARSLSKEAFAYMVDRRGAGCTIAEICSVLWENRPIDTNLKSQCRVILSSLKKDLEAVGAGDVLVKGWNVWGIDTTKVSCDYYDFLRNEGESGTYAGEYLAQYSWAEMTSGTLYQMSSEQWHKVHQKDTERENKSRRR